MRYDLLERFVRKLVQDIGTGLSNPGGISSVVLRDAIGLSCGPQDWTRVAGACAGVRQSQSMWILFRSTLFCPTPSIAEIRARHHNPFSPSPSYPPGIAAGPISPSFFSWWQGS